MYGNNEIVSYLQANKILALKLDHAVTAVGQNVKTQVNMIGKGATRLLYYASCFTDEYNDVCLRQKSEDLRFRDAVYKLVSGVDVVYEMLRLYFEEVFKYKNPKQLEYIKQRLMAVNVHIAAVSLTGAGFTLAVAACVRLGLNISLELSAITGRWASRGIAFIGLYGVVQQAADSAHRLYVEFPAWYSALYAQELEMLYFLIEPVFRRTDATRAQWASDDDIADIITRLIR
ncbi:hypothetical protein [Enterobacter hormaechei]|uniref:hypothetical protein n=1 Tax=Enterobacter hormaechei TaxID=158836 RepID=UPI000651490C|nr:hypothetical protein [Enterobacter hormaechei]KLW05064.1 hypothetical protein SK45_03878 [Enterobacter hormaechei]KLW09706.1 hypothetical protein SK46_03463 [Enterobacter hormaechei]